MTGDGRAGDGGTGEEREAGVARAADDALLLDVMLGKLATYLLLVSRDEQLVRRSGDAVLVTGREITDQLAELREAGFGLELAPEPAYCSACNGDLEPVDRTEPTPDYAPAPGERDVWRCEDCGQHFWKGSHWDDVAATLEAL